MSRSRGREPARGSWRSSRPMDTGTEPSRSRGLRSRAEPNGWVRPTSRRPRSCARQGSSCRSWRGCTRWAPPPLEIIADGLFDTATKYDGSARFTVPAYLESEDAAALTQAALRMFDALGCAGVARIDFFLTDDGPVLNEVNTMPGMTAESQVPRMFAAAGVPYEELVARLIADATVSAAGPPAPARRTW